MRKPAIERDTTRERWELTERPELMTTFREQIYGAPPGNGAVELSWRHLTEQHLPGGETQRQIALSLRGPFGGVTLTLLVRLPAAAQDVPAFLGLNFRGNHACTTHPDVLSIADGDTSETGEIHYDGL
ncbi:MAG TPA: hypothetical protein VI076_03380, partial [Actinopolymorphaceae bacterium]